MMMAYRLVILYFGKSLNKMAIKTLVIMRALINNLFENSFKLVSDIKGL